MGEFLRIPSVNVVLIEKGIYRVSNGYVDATDGKTAYARIAEDQYVKLLPGGGIEPKMTSNPDIMWDRMGGVAYNEMADSVQLLYAVQPPAMVLSSREDSTFPQAQKE